MKSVSPRKRKQRSLPWISNAGFICRCDFFAYRKYNMKNSSSRKKKRAGAPRPGIWERQNRLTKFSLIFFIVGTLIFGLYWNNISRTEDSSIPEISIESEEIHVSVRDPEEILLEGVTARDRKDGDVTDSLLVESLSPFVSRNTRLIRYAAFDSDNHVSHASRKLIYTDYYSPRFHLEMPLIFRLNYSDVIDGLTAMDCLDGDITSLIKVVPEKDFTVEKAGLYDVTFQVSNSAGDLQSFSTQVEIYDSSSGRGLELTLTDYLVYIRKGMEFDPADYLESVRISGREYPIERGWGNFYSQYLYQESDRVVGTDMLEIDNPVRTDAPGSYTVRYTLSVETRNQEILTGTCPLIVIVRE